MHFLTCLRGQGPPPAPPVWPAMRPALHAHAPHWQLPRAERDCWHLHQAGCVLHCLHLHCVCRQQTTAARSWLSWVLTAARAACWGVGLHLVGQWGGVTAAGQSPILIRGWRAVPRWRAPTTRRCRQLTLELAPGLCAGRGGGLTDWTVAPVPPHQALPVPVATVPRAARAERPCGLPLPPRQMCGGCCLG